VFNSVEQGPFLGINCSTCEIPSLLWNPKLHYIFWVTRYWAVSWIEWLGYTSLFLSLGKISLRGRSCNQICSVGCKTALNMSFSSVVRWMLRIRDGLLLGRAIGHLPCAVATHTIRLYFLVNGTASSRVFVVSVSYLVPATGYLGWHFIFSSVSPGKYRNTDNPRFKSRSGTSGAYRNSVYMRSTVRLCVCVYTRGSIWNSDLICHTMTASPPSVLLPNSILPPHLSHYAFIPSGKNASCFWNGYFRFFILFFLIA
jgi:hypothetical protein